jgi:hypothetical protein
MDRFSPLKRLSRLKIEDLLMPFIVFGAWGFALRATTGQVDATSKVKGL